jgi:hypothetical protein
MRITIKISIVIGGLIAGYVNSSSAALNVENGCEFYDSKTASTPYAGVTALLQTLPESSSVIMCNGERNVEISVLDPIDNRDGVSFYRRTYFEVSAGHFAKATNAKELLSGREPFHLTIMALDPNSELTHQSEAIVKTDSLSVGTFKLLYNLWMEVFEDPEKLKLYFDVSSLADESKAQYEKFMQSLNSGTKAKIDYLQFQDLHLADGDGIELEFFPRLVVNISTKNQWWEIDYDMLDNERYTLLNVELQMEATGAK